MCPARIGIGPDERRRSVVVGPFHRYALADAATDPDVHAAQQAAINGPAPFEFKAYDLDGTPETDFSEWIRKWGEDSWVPARQPGDSGVNGFPYSGIGITGNWLAAGPEPALPADSFLALSEFILKADAPIYWLGVRSASQYFGVPDSMAGQVSWCDSCLGDIDMSGAVDTGDLLMLIEGWGTRNPGMLFGLGDSHPSAVRARSCPRSASRICSADPALGAVQRLAGRA